MTSYESYSPSARHATASSTSWVLNSAWRYPRSGAEHSLPTPGQDLIGNSKTTSWLSDLVNRDWQWVAEGHFSRIWGTASSESTYDSSRSSANHEITVDSQQSRCIIWMSWVFGSITLNVNPPRSYSLSFASKSQRSSPLGRSMMLGSRKSSSLPSRLFTSG